MAQWLPFFNDGTKYDVPEKEARILVARLRQRPDGDDVTTADGGLAAAIQTAIDGESKTGIDLGPWEHTSLDTVISEMIGSGETSGRSALARLRDAISSD